MTSTQRRVGLAAVGASQLPRNQDRDNRHDRPTNGDGGGYAPVLAEGARQRIADRRAASEGRVTAARGLEVEGTLRVLRLDEEVRRQDARVVRREERVRQAPRRETREVDQVVRETAVRSELLLADVDVRAGQTVVRGG